IVITRGMVISASGLTPVTDRPRFRKKKGRWYDLHRARLAIEEVETGDDVEPEDVLRWQPAGLGRDGQPLGRKQLHHRQPPMRQSAC
ncbi:hypothetical protein, partial [Mesorhizobium sp. M1A.F.Ca.IN.022.04.1.1]|uniref:hypothetical protein n=2 Tax=unclassified Mesorhizobium TaxID=325217 RepID=UPI0013E03647